MDKRPVDYSTTIIKLAVLTEEECQMLRICRNAPNNLIHSILVFNGETCERMVSGRKFT